MSKYNTGDYIRCIEENRQQVIDKLGTEGGRIYHKDELFPDMVYCKHQDGNWVALSIYDSYAKNDITESFFADEKPIQQLPEKWYLDCGDRIEVRQWLKDLGYVWHNGRDLTEDPLDRKILFNDRVDGTILWAGKNTQLIDRTKITPTFGNKTITVDCVTGFTVEDKRNTELEKLEAAYREMGEIIKSIRGGL